MSASPPDNLNAEIKWSKIFRHQSMGQNINGLLVRDVP